MTGTELKCSAMPKRIGRLASSKGFTLIEIAIVLIIVGLLLGGVLKGQELINSAKAKNIAQDFRNVQVAVYGYQDKYRALPGDDGTARRDASNAAVTTVGDGDGKITGTCAPTGGETALVWRDLRMGGFVTGDASQANYDYQTNSLGGKICILSNLRAIFTAAAGAANAADTKVQGTFIVCSGGIPGDLAQRVDTQLDDGKPDTGSMVATANAIGDIKNTAAATATAATAYGSGTYTLCFAF